MRVFVCPIRYAAHLATVLRLSGTEPLVQGCPLSPSSTCSKTVRNSPTQWKNSETDAGIARFLLTDIKTFMVAQLTIINLNFTYLLRMRHITVNDYTNTNDCHK